MNGVDLRGGPALTVVTGPPGVGRSYALRATAVAAARQGTPVLALRLAPEDRGEPWYLAGRILASLNPARPSGRAAEPPAAALAGLLRRRPGLILVLDDAQWADAESAEAIRDVLDDPAGSPILCVAAVRTGGPPVLRLRPGLRARVVPLRPRRADDAVALAARMLRATPHEDLAAALRRYGVGLPAAIDAVVTGYRDAGQLVVADGRAGLRDPAAVPLIPAGHQILRPVHRLDQTARAVARALAVLQPFGPAAPALIERALGLTADQVRRQLAAARTEGIVRCGSGGWTVTSPALALGLVAGHGPYERRRIAQVAVETLWADPSAVTDPHYLPDRLAEAGASVDPDRAVAQLRDVATAEAGRSPADAARWWAAAAELSGSAADHAEAALSEATAMLRRGLRDEADRVLEPLLTAYADDLTPAQRDEAVALLAGTAPDADAAGRYTGPGRERRRAAAALTGARGGDPVAAGLHPARLPLADRCLLDFRAGRWTAALDGAVLAEAAGKAGTGPSVARVAAEVLLAQGRPARARTVLDAAADQPLHLLAPALTDLHRALGDPQAAARTVRVALDRSAAGELWVLAAELAAEHGDPVTARAAREAPLPAYWAATVRMITDGDAAAADEAVQWARALGQPYELARTLERAVRWAGRNPVALAEAYEILGDLGALLHRSRLRRAARERGVSVAGRAETVAEGDRLLAVLVADGLSNKELAAATQNSEKSVEGRLSRLFARTGYRSRVELATAVLAGTFPTGAATVSAGPGR
ncbi:AAA family ATPase [Micromonospora sp. NPDC049523]|uniref:AAA family ATPase n=1 Tax=Micromonospora sp. NPDC049523 TaxID=3155921 RepID=UPI0034376359